MNARNYINLVKQQFYYSKTRHEESFHRSSIDRVPSQRDFRSSVGKLYLKVSNSITV